jgi:hypothetical protein
MQNKGKLAEGRRLQFPELKNQEIEAIEEGVRGSAEADQGDAPTSH